MRMLTRDDYNAKLDIIISLVRLLSEYDDTQLSALCSTACRLREGKIEDKPVTLLKCYNVMIKSHEKEMIG